tara:strand:+ start:8005 stop:8400 length:396 start_codon:yes stop_codon:yes gene_type:complete
MKNTEDKIVEALESVTALLLSKNRAYGDSALAPANIFAGGSAVENLCSRIDDKLMRIKNRGINEKTLDTIDDLIGYLTLLKIAINDEHQPTRQEDITVQDSAVSERTVSHNYWFSTPTYSEWQGKLVNREG